jgi:hypothetical protein
MPLGLSQCVARAAQGFRVFPMEAGAKSTRATGENAPTSQINGFRGKREAKISLLRATDRKRQITEGLRIFGRPPKHLSEVEFGSSLSWETLAYHNKNQVWV